MKMRTTLSLLTVASLVLLYSGAVQADVVTGRLWQVSEATASLAIPGNVPASAPNVIFTTDSTLDFNGASPVPITVGAWLATDTGLSIVSSTPGALTRLIDDATTGTFVELTGRGIVATGQRFSFAHDDGITLTINGLGVTPPFTTGPSPGLIQSAIYGGPSGNDLPYQLVYGECCLGNALLDGALPSQIPEPSTFLLFATGLGILGYGWRRRKQQA